MKMRCYFTINAAVCFVDGQSVADFNKGFWVDESFAMVAAHYLDRRYWIPPHAIQYIERVKNDWRNYLRRT